MLRRKLALGVLASTLLVAVAAVLFACSQTPTSVPVRTFERAQRMDVVCLQLFDNNLNPQVPAGRPVDECAPVATTTLNPGGFQKQLFALVTQTQRGELAVVNLSAGTLVDQSRATPGINFLPVGSIPTDVATSPDGVMAFVAAAEVNKAAIYGIPTTRILGDTDSRFPAATPATLASWPVCSLPQNPASVTVVPRRGAPLPSPATDAGSDAGDAGVGAGDAGVATASDYEIVVVLPGDRANSAKVLTIDPRPFQNGVLVPGQLTPCAPFVTAAVELSGASAVPSTFTAGPNWDDGVKYVEGGVDLTCLRPAPAANCGLPPCCGNNTIIAPDAAGSDATAPEAGPPDPDAGGACAPVTAPDAGPVTLDFGPLDPPRLVAVARDDQTLYVADEGVPFIHVLDLTTPGAPRELPPLLATSVLDPARIVQVKDLAISPPTRDFKRFLYAVDRIDGSIMVFDVTDPASTQRTPLTRPHPELNPFQAADRIVFGSPVVTVAFARHDVPLAHINAVATPSAATGILCNPNPNLDNRPANMPLDLNNPLELGFYYRPGNLDPQQDFGPRRLRGVFGFATLANGQVFAIDVDDWDSPCRRPIDMTAPTPDHPKPPTSDIAPPEPLPSGPTDEDPYHAPDGGSTTVVTNEAFFPMAAPHTVRSMVFVRDDPTSGNNLPRLQGVPTLTSNSVILPQSGVGSENTPLIDTVHFATEIPQVHIDQDWSFTWEGALPGFDGISGLVTSDDNFSSLLFSQGQGHFCSKGVEDWAQGIVRTNAIAVELAKRGLKPAPGADRLTSDYIELTEDMLPPDDPYWTLQQDCWQGTSLEKASGVARQDACVRTYGAASDQSPERDFPITEAFDDHFRLGRFFTFATAGTASSKCVQELGTCAVDTDCCDPKQQCQGKKCMPRTREVVFSDPSNVSSLKLMKCCFHDQARFKVRTGNLWSGVGVTAGATSGGIGFLSHLTTDPAGRCVPSCEPRDALLNGRVPQAPSGVQTIGRNSALGFRNPMFDFQIFAAASGLLPPRDAVYAFSARGQFQPLFISIAGTSTAVNPQSMRFIPTLGQIAVVDGASQGLVLLDLQQVTVARAPYF